MGHEASRLASCPLCARLGDPHAALRICELRESVVFLHEHQRYEGWCVLVLKEHAEQLHALPVSRQVRLWEDVAQVAGAITRAFAPRGSTTSALEMSWGTCTGT